MNKIGSWISQLNKNARIGFVASIIWILFFFVIGISKADGFGYFDLEEFVDTFILYGIGPVVLGWGIRWIKKA